MNVTSATVDRIVADVLAKLGEQSADVGRAQKPTTDRVAQPIVAAKAFDLDLAHASVLTGDMLESIHTGSSIRVSKAVVLTPSGRDAVAKRGLTLVRGDAADKGTLAKPTSLMPKLLVVTSTAETRSLADTLARAGWSIDYPGCDGDAIAAARSSVCRGDASFVAVIAPRPNRTAQRLNRTRNVLATAVFPETSVGELQSEGDWNVACLAADRWASFRLRKTLETLAKGAAG